MDYNLKSAEPTIIDFSIKRGGKTGAIPHEMFISKFEETDMGNDEHMYDNFARETLTDWGPDKPMMTSEEPFRNGTRSSGRLNLQYYGHRGSSDDPAHPEMFLAFHGPEHIDPRGDRNIPDMTKFADQHKARMRFQNFRPENHDWVTGGTMSIEQEVKNKQEVMKWTKDRLKVFSRTIDSMRPKHARTWKNCSKIANQELTAEKWQMNIKDAHSYKQQNRESMRSDKNRNKAENDANFHVQNYSKITKNKNLQNNQNRIIAAQIEQLTDGNQTLMRKLGAIMTDMTEARTGQKTDAERGESMEGRARKYINATKEMLTILAQKTESDYGESNEGTIVPFKRREHINRKNNIYNHIRPTQFISELMFKSAKPGEKHKIRTEALSDQNQSELTGVLTHNFKQNNQKAKNGVDINAKYEDLIDTTHQTHNYKQTIKAISNKVAEYNGENLIHDSSNTQIKQQNNQQNTMYRYENFNIDNKFGDNSYQERTTGKYGNKTKVRQSMVNDVKEWQ